jgi:CRP/FNR family transcriptional regulator, cyclic AMP receptor protein
VSELIRVPKDDYLVREGEEGSTLYFLQTGSLAVYKRKGDIEQQIGTIYAGEVVGEMSFLDKEPRSASVKAISDCELLVIPSEKFEAFKQKLPSWYNALVSTLLDRLRKANNRIKI